jgi:D-alanyl-D-alanine carboxypeptidase
MIRYQNLLRTARCMFSGVLALAVACASVAAAQPAVVGAPAAHRTATPAGLQDTVDQARVAADIPGCIVLIALPDGREFSVASGVRNVAAGTPLREDDLFRIGSITKTFTGVLALKLAEQGRLKLDDPLVQYVPEAREWFSGMVEIDKVTLRNLLQHTSGIPDYVEPLMNLPPRIIAEMAQLSWDEYDIPELVYGRPALFPVGEGCSYTNTGYALLGIALERASGLSLARLLHRYIFDPLRLRHTYYAATEHTPPQVDGYRRDHMGLHQVTSWDRPEIAAAGGGILTNLADLQAYAQALFGGGLLTPEQWSQMTGWRKMSDTQDYGLGLSRFHEQGLDELGHGGGTLGYRAGMYYIQSEDVLVLGLANRGSSPLEDVMYAALKYLVESGTVIPRGPLPKGL